MKRIGFEGTIISYEPVKSTYEKLKTKASEQKNWIAKNIALGDEDGETEINVTENTLSSSLLAPLSNFIATTPEAKVVSKEIVKVKKLDTVFNEIKDCKNNLFLKIDSQGFEKKILDGAKESLHHFKGIQIELSLMSLYEGEETFFELFPFLLSQGYKLYEIEKGYCNPTTGEALQVELILFRN